jgi:hypothetical protein
MKPQLALHFVGSDGLWAPVDRYDSIAAELADGHYSRQSPGDDQYLRPGRYVAFVHRGDRGRALWSVVHNVWLGVWRWTNTHFANKSGTLSSLLVQTATQATYRRWIERYGKLPAEPLRTEVDVEATAARRSRRSEPGHCYRIAGWREVDRYPSKRGTTLVVLEAPR